MELRQLITALQALHEEIESLRPELVVLDGNFVGSEKSLQAEDILKLKRKYGFQLVVFVLDHFPEGSTSDHAIYWDEVADKQVVFTEYVPDEPGFDPKKLVRGL